MLVGNSRGQLGCILHQVKLTLLYHLDGKVTLTSVEIWSATSSPQQSHTIPCMFITASLCIVIVVLKKVQLFIFTLSKKYPQPFHLLSFVCWRICQYCMDTWSLQIGRLGILGYTRSLMSNIWLLRFCQEKFLKEYLILVVYDMLPVNIVFTTV